MKKKIGVLLALLVLVVFGVSWYFSGKSYVIEIPEAHLQRKLSEKFPFEKTYFFVLSLKFEQPNLSLQKNSDRIAFGCKVITNIAISSSGSGKESIGGRLEASGALRYDGSKAAFYLDDPQIAKLDIEGIPEKYQTKVESAVKKALVEFVNRAPVYKLKKYKTKELAASLILKDVQVRDSSLFVTLGIGD